MSPLTTRPELPVRFGFSWFFNQCRKSGIPFGFVFKIALRLEKTNAYHLRHLPAASVSTSSRNRCPGLPQSAKEPDQGNGSVLATAILKSARFAETPVVGNLELFTAPEWWGGIRCINVPVVSRFIVFCTREERPQPQGCLSASLS